MACPALQTALELSAQDCACPREPSLFCCGACPLLQDCQLAAMQAVCRGTLETRTEVGSCVTCALRSASPPP